MALDEFLQLSDCPTALSPALQALWYDRQGNWPRAHALVQDEGDHASAWVHAYLHRKEGDPSNASYWYRRAQKPPSHEDLIQEWNHITQTLLTDPSTV